MSQRRYVFSVVVQAKFSLFYPARFPRFGSPYTGTPASFAPRLGFTSPPLPARVQAPPLMTCPIVFPRLQRISFSPFLSVFLGLYCFSHSPQFLFLLSPLLLPSRTTHVILSGAFNLLRSTTLTPAHHRGIPAFLNTILLSQHTFPNNQFHHFHI